MLEKALGFEVDWKEVRGFDAKALKTGFCDSSFLSGCSAFVFVAETVLATEIGFYPKDKDV